MNRSPHPSPFAEVAAPAGYDRRAILALLALTIGLRVAAVDRPLVGHFATKNVVYAMAARNWAEGVAPAWQPTLDCLAEGERSWHLMEWPASAFLTSLAWRTGGGSLDAWGRITAIAWTCLAVVCAYRLGRRKFGELEGRVAGFVLACAPVSIIYGQSFMLEASIAALSLLAVDALDVWLHDRRPLALVASAVATALLVVTKIYLLGMLGVLGLAAWRRLRNEADGRRRATFAVPTFFIALAPAAAWYLWVAQVSPISGPAADFHPFSRAAVHGFPHPLLFDPAYYVRLAYFIAGIMLTPLGLIAACVGACDRRYREVLPWLAFALSLPVLLPLKFFHANYYFLVVLPPAALAAGCGWRRLRAIVPAPWLRCEPLVAAAAVAAALYLSIGPAFRTPDEDWGVVEAGRLVDRLAAADEPIATLHGSTIDLLYYSRRTGWALNADDPQFAARLHDVAAQGARRLVVADHAGALRRPIVSGVLRSLPIERAEPYGVIYRLDGATARHAPTSSR